MPANQNIIDTLHIIDVIASTWIQAMEMPAGICRASSGIQRTIRQVNVIACSGKGVDPSLPNHKHARITRVAARTARSWAAHAQCVCMLLQRMHSIVNSISSHRHACDGTSSMPDSSLGHHGIQFWHCVSVTSDMFACDSMS